MNENQEIAKFILQLARSAQAPTDDTTQTNIMVAKRWLQQIISGALVVGKPIAEDKAPMEPVK